MKGIARLCVEDMMTRLQSIAVLKNKTLFVLDEKDFEKKLSTIAVFPAVGIQYEGIRSATEPTGTGVSGVLVLSLMILEQSSSVVVTDTKGTTMDLLDELRRSILTTSSPSRHKWKFVVEAPAAEMKGKVLWLQRWQTAVQLLNVTTTPGFNN